MYSIYFFVFSKKIKIVELPQPKGQYNLTHVYFVFAGLTHVYLLTPQSKALHWILFLVRLLVRIHFFYCVRWSCSQLSSLFFVMIFLFTKRIQIYYKYLTQVQNILNIVKHTSDPGPSNNHYRWQNEPATRLWRRSPTRTSRMTLGKSSCMYP